MVIDTEKYKGFEIEVHFNKETKCFSAQSKVAISHNPFDTNLKNFCMGFKSPIDKINKHIFIIQKLIKKENEKV